MSASSTSGIATTNTGEQIAWKAGSLKPTMSELELSEESRNTIRFIFLVGVCVVAYQIWLGLDQAGYERRTVSANITAESGWMPGETKQCNSTPLPGRLDKDNPKGDVFSFIECDKGPSHTVNIKFYGQQLQPNKVAAFWSCTRNFVSDLDDPAFTCKQTGAL